MNRIGAMFLLASLVAVVLVACSNPTQPTEAIPAITPSQSMTVPADLRNYRYCEVIPVFREGLTLPVQVYNTIGLNDCPAALWAKLDDKAVAKQYGATIVKLNGPRFGCGLGQCGACTVIVEGEAVRSCITPMSAVQGFEITTLEGLGSSANPHPIQKAFIDNQAVQCGYCINGMIMTAKALLDQNPKATTSDIRQALEGNICRCGTHGRILKALTQYSQEVLA